MRNLWVFLAVLAGVSGAYAEDFRVAVNTSEQGAPISKYIYGQFIEHLGRCIYGGLWAEMLEDRKFFYPVTGEAPAWELHYPSKESWAGEGHAYEVLKRSPWMILGAKDAVHMDRAAPYVGEHTPVIDLPDSEVPAGLQQERLGLVAGKEYTGRIVLRRSGGTGPVQVSLAWGSGAVDRDCVLIESPSDEFVTYPLHFLCERDTDNGRLEIMARGPGQLAVGAVSLMPSDNLLGWRADTVALLKELNSPVYRWPGGNFVSGYNWRDGLGEPDRRPPRKNPAWLGIEANDVGMHEFMALCQEIGAEPFVAVNTGLGTVDAAAEQVAYANAPADTPLGRQRAENGSARPFGVKFWAIGNEMYGGWQLGHMPLEDYVKKHNAVVDAMRAADPSIEPIAVGNAGPWSEAMLTHCADHMRLISEHSYWQDKADLIAHVAQPVNAIRSIAKAHRKYRGQIEGLKDKDIRIALDEWNFWYGGCEYGEIGVQYFLQDALGVGAALHEMFRNSDMYFMANYAQTVNVIGCIKTTATQAAFDTTGLVLKLYRQRFGEIPVAVSGKYGPLDVSAALSEDGTALTLGVMNPLDSAQRLSLELEGTPILPCYTRWTISGADRMARNRPGEPPEVTLSQTGFRDAPGPLDVPALSVSVFVFPLR